MAGWVDMGEAKREMRQNYERMTTETLDKLYLEWSQFTRARTAREIVMLAALKAWADHFKMPGDPPPEPGSIHADMLAAIAKAEQKD